MKVIIAGSRNVTDPRIVDRAVKASGWHMDITEVIHGGARGVDTLAGAWARGFDIPVRAFPANWREHGRAAGPIRNRIMAEHGQALIAIWDGESRGTKNMIEEAKRRGLKVFIYPAQL